MHGNMPTHSKYKAVLSRTVISQGMIKQLHVVKQVNKANQNTYFEVSPFDLETESTVMVDYPVALLRSEQIDCLTTIDNMDQLIDRSRRLSAEATDADSAVLLVPRHISVLDFQIDNLPLDL